MLRPQHIQGIFPSNQYFYPKTRTRTSIYPRIPNDVNWSKSWPTKRTILLGGIILLINAAIIALDIANLAIEGNKVENIKSFGFNTAEVGAGIWSGSISFLAGLFIITITFIHNKRVIATFALIFTILAFFFSIVLVGLTANAIQINQYDNESISLDRKQYRFLIAILSLAAFNITLCLAFFIIYTIVLLSSSHLVK